MLNTFQFQNINQNRYILHLCMINFTRFVLENGLRVIIHEDHTTPLTAMNIVYDVGARDEHPEKTGFAHLFEHLMFEGSVNIPSYDTPLQLAGGSNNAFTSNDITNYYLTLPSAHIETGFWLESDRMLELAFSQEKLDIQKKVVSEEFKQRYLNQPYGDLWLVARPFMYKQHPYQWATIGKSLEHIEKATLDDVTQFFFTHYAPNNAVLVISGSVETEKIKSLCDKWFGSIPRRDVPKRNLPVEPKQEELKRMRVERNVPSDALMMAYHMCGKTDADYYAYDLMSDVLSGSNSSRMHEVLIKEKRIFTEVGAYVLGSVDPGLFIFFGKLDHNFSIEDGEKAIRELIDEIKTQPVSASELQKVKNKFETQERFSKMNVLDKAMKLAFAELLGDANEINTELDRYLQVSSNDIHRIANACFTDSNCSILEYKAIQS